MNHREILDSLAFQGGGLVEIYVGDTTYSDWCLAVQGLFAAGYILQFTELVSEQAVDFGWHLFDRDEDVAYRLTILLNGQTWTTNFFSVETIDIQGDPRDITSAETLDDVVRLMQVLNLATAKCVRMIAESLQPELTRPYFSVGNCDA